MKEKVFYIVVLFGLVMLSTGVSLFSFVFEKECHSLPLRAA